MKKATENKTISDLTLKLITYLNLSDIKVPKEFTGMVYQALYIAYLEGKNK